MKAPSKHSFMFGASIALVLLMLTVACTRMPPIIQRARGPLKQQIVRCVLEIKLEKVAKVGASLNESPSIVGINRQASVRVIRVQAGVCSDFKALRLQYDKNTIHLNPGQYLLFLDRSSHWLDWKPIVTSSRKNLIKRARKAVGQVIRWP